MHSFPWLTRWQYIMSVLFNCQRIKTNKSITHQNWAESHYNYAGWLMYLNVPARWTRKGLDCLNQIFHNHKPDNKNIHNKTLSLPIMNHYKTVNNITAFKNYIISKQGLKPQNKPHYSNTQLSLLKQTCLRHVVMLSSLQCCCRLEVI